MQCADERRRQGLVLGPAASDPAHHRDRLVRDRPDVGLRHLRGEVAVDREPGDDLRAQRGVVLRQPLQGLLQQRDVLGVHDAELVPRPAGVPERRAGERARVAGLAGGDRGTAEARARLLPVAGVGLGGRQRVLQPRELRRVAVLVAPPQRDRRAQQPRRLLVGEPADGLRRGALGVADGAVRAAWPGGAEVPRQLGEPGIRPRAVQLLDRLADPQVQPRPPGRRQLGLERRPQQRVGERVAPGRARDLDQQRAAHRGVEHVEQLVLGQAGDALEHVEVEVAADQRGDAEHAAGVLGQAAHPGRDDVADPLRSPQGAVAAQAGGTVDLDEVADEMLDEERVAARLVVDRPHGRARRVLAVPGLDEPAHLLLVHAVEPQPRHLARALELGEQLGQRMPGVQLVGPERADQEDRPEARLAREMAGQEERRAVGPVEVVDDQQHGTARGQPAHHDHHGAEELPALRLRIPGGGQLGEVGEAHADLGQQPRELGRPRHQRRQLGVRQRREPRAQHVDPRAEGVQLLLVAAAVEHREVRQPAGQLRDDARLADARLARDEHEPALARRGVLRPLPEPAQRRLAADPLGREGLREPVGDPVRPGLRRAGRRRCAGRRTGEQPLVERAHRLAGRHAELVAQQHPQPLVGAQRLGELAPGGERLHEQPVARLPQRRRPHELRRGALRGVGVRTAERGAGLRQRLQRAKPHLLELPAMLLDPGCIVAHEQAATGDRRPLLPLPPARRAIGRRSPRCALAPPPPGPAPRRSPRRRAAPA